MIVVMLIAAFYAYSREIQEIKYIYVLFPIFCVLACFAFKIFLEKFQRKNLIFCMIIGGIILSSMIFVEWKATDNEHYREAYQILTEIGQKEIKINKEFGKSDGEFFFFHWVMVETAEKFPILQKELPPDNIKYAGIMAITQDQANPDAVFHLDLYNLRDYFQFLEKQKVTHLILDKYSGDQLQHELSLNLLDIFNHENKYPFLIKEYDSKENGFNYHLKLFKIDYDLYDEWINEEI